MASAATPGIFRGNPTNLPYIFGQKLDSPSNSKGTPIIFLVSDDISEQEAVKSLIGREGWHFETCESVDEFLARPRAIVPSCVILALSVPDLKVLEGQKQIARERAEVPILVISRCGDVRTSVQAMKAGAVDFMVAPFSHEILLPGIRESLERSRHALDRELGISELRNCYTSLSRRERQVMALVVSGLLNKQVGGELGISEITVKAHRRHLMLKMKANCLPDLVRMALELGSARKQIRLA